MSKSNIALKTWVDKDVHLGKYCLRFLKINQRFITIFSKREESFYHGGNTVYLEPKRLNDTRTSGDFIFAFI